MEDKGITDCSEILLSNLHFPLEVEHSVRLRHDEIPVNPSFLSGRELRINL